MMTFDFILYHKSCPDGEVSKYLYKKYISDNCLEGQWQFYGMAAGSNGPEVLTPEDYTNMTVLMLDCSFVRDNLIKIASFARSITILDHHKSAQDQIGIETVMSMPNNNVHVTFDMERCGGQITSDCFFPLQPRLWFVDLVGDRDLWRFKDSRTKAFYAYMTMHNMHNGKGFRELQEYNDTQIAELCEKGESYLVCQDKEVETIAGYHKLVDFPTAHGTTGSSTKYRVALVQCLPHLSSEVGNKLVFTVDCDIAIMYRYDFDKDLYHFSCRSRKTEIDLSVILVEFGGGGHPKAAGFRSKGVDSLTRLFTKIPAKLNFVTMVGL